MTAGSIGRRTGPFIATKEHRRFTEFAQHDSHASHDWFVLWSRRSWQNTLSPPPCQLGCSRTAAANMGAA